MAIDGRSAKPVNARNPGPYEAVVVSHLDPKYMGTLEVELLKNVSAGNQAERSGQIVQVKYMSPFYGVTPLSGTSNNDDFESTQQSYGMWFVPPDVGTRVLVIFAEGNFSRGYWIGCVQDTFMNFMTPDPYAGTTFNNRDSGLKLPVGEYNKTIQGTSGNNPTRYPKPVNPFLYRRLLQQGLIDDPVRGPSSSSARREVPSSVFGISTPGPQDKTEGAPRTPTGPSGARANTFTSRLGGSSFVMDDGDDKFLRKGPASSSPSEYADLYAGEGDGEPTIPANELIRLRTRTGHQILLHNSEDLIYIGNARGTSWIEMSSNGKLDIYAADSVSVHTGQDLNFTADRDINFTAFQNVNFVVGDQMRTDVGNSYSLTTGDYIASNAGGSISEHAQGSITNYAFSGWTAVSQTKMSLLAASNLNIGSTAAIGIECDGDLQLHTDSNYDLKSIGNMTIETESDYDLKSIGNMRIQTDTGYDLKIDGPTNIETTGEIGLQSTGGNITIKGTSDVLINGPTPPSAATALPPFPPTVADPTDAVPPTRAAQTARVPQHEPWYEHENINPRLFTPANTRAGSAQQQSYPPPQNDTFAHGSTAPERRTVDTSERPAGYDATGGTYDATASLPSATGGTPAGPLTSPPAGLIDGFNAQQTVNYLNAVGTRESNNAYDAVNTIGFSGKYQFGELALEDLGYLNAGANRLGTNAQVLGDPANWTGKDGITSQQDWLNSPAVQEKAMVEYTNKNRRILERINGIRDGDDLPTQSGMLAGAHLLGGGGMRNWREGRGGADAYGTTGGEYFTLGSNAVA